MGIQEVPLVFHFEEFPEEEGRTSKWRPIIGGIQLQRFPGLSSTLSFAAKDRDIGTLGYVISGHVASAAGIDGTIYQPTVSVFNKIGTVGAIGGTYADAGWVEYDDVESTIYAFDNDITKSVVSYRDPELNWFVYKSGIATGTTSGVVSGVYKMIGSQTFGTLYDQSYANYDSAPGDSGSPVFRLDGTGNVELLGVHLGSLGGTAYFSPISGVYLDLGVVPLTS